MTECLFMICPLIYSDLKKFGKKRFCTCPFKSKLHKYSSSVRYFCCRAYAADAVSFLKSEFSLLFNENKLGSNFFLQTI